MEGEHLITTSEGETRDDDKMSRVYNIVVPEQKETILEDGRQLCKKKTDNENENNKKKKSEIEINKLNCLDSVDRVSEDDDDEAFCVVSFPSGINKAKAKEETSYEDNTNGLLNGLVACTENEKGDVGSKEVNNVKDEYELNATDPTPIGNIHTKHPEDENERNELACKAKSNSEIKSNNIREKNSIADLEKEDKDDSEEEIQKKCLLPRELVDQIETGNQTPAAFEISFAVNLHAQDWNNFDLDSSSDDVKGNSIIKHDIGNINDEHDDVKHKNVNNISVNVKNEDANQRRPINLESKINYTFCEEDEWKEERRKRIDNMIDIKADNSSTKSIIRDISENENDDEISGTINDSQHISKQIDSDDESLHSQEELTPKKCDGTTLPVHYEVGVDKDMKIVNARSINRVDEIECSSCPSLSSDTETSNVNQSDQFGEGILKLEIEIEPQCAKKNEQSTVNEQKGESPQSNCTDGHLPVNEASSAYSEENNIEDIYRTEIVSKRYQGVDDQKPDKMKDQKAEDEAVLTQKGNTNSSVYEQETKVCPCDEMKRENVRSNETEMLSPISLYMESKQPNNDHCEDARILVSAEKQQHESEHIEHKNKLKAQNNEPRQLHYNDETLHSKGKGIANASFNGEYTISETNAIDTENDYAKSIKTFNESEHTQLALTETIDCEETIVKEIVESSVELEATYLSFSNEQRSILQTNKIEMSVEEDLIAQNEENSLNFSEVDASNSGTDREKRKITIQRRKSSSDYSSSTSAIITNPTHIDNTVLKRVTANDDQNSYSDLSITMSLLKVGYDWEKTNCDENRNEKETMMKNVHVNMFEDGIRNSQNTVPTIIVFAVGFEPNGNMGLYTQNQFEPEDDDLIPQNLPWPDFPFQIRAIMLRIHQQNARENVQDNMQAVHIENGVNVPVQAGHVGEPPPIPEAEACAVQVIENEEAVETIVTSASFMFNDSTVPEAANVEEPYLSHEIRRLQQENARLREMQICKICTEKPVMTTFLPCGHLVCCDRCAPTITKCPVCRKLIRHVIRTFRS